MPIDFPNSPTNGQTVTFANSVYTWNAAKSTWDLSVATAAGPGVAPGGTTGQILAKASSTDYNTTWIDNYTSQVKHLAMNQTGSLIPKGSVVYITGSNGTNMLLGLADADTEATSSKTIGLVQADIANGAEGFVVTEGLLAGLNTSAATAGQSVWLSSTAGGFVFGAPPAKPAHAVYLGVVTRVQSQNGEIFVKVQNGYEIDELHDVNAGSPVDNDVLAWDSASSMWINQTAAQAGLATASHTHTIANVTGLQTALDGKAGAFVYTLPDTGNVANTWLRLGTWTTAQNGQSLLIRVTSKNGYNAISDQDQFTTLRFKTANGGAFQAGTSGNFFGDGTATVDTGLGGAAVAPSLFRIVQVSTTSYEIFGQFGSYTGGHFYEVIATSGTSWSHSGASATPSGNSIDVLPNSGSRVLNISANYTLTAGDRGKTVVSTGGAITVTVPAVLNVGERIDFIQDGTGQITFTASGVTLQSSGGLLKTANRYAAATIICVAASQYRLIGNLG